MNVNLNRRLRDVGQGADLPGQAETPSAAGGSAANYGPVKDQWTDLRKKNMKSPKTVDLAVPVEGEKGFYILKSK